MAVILDLDLTLVDSSAAAELRRQRAWSSVYDTIPRFRLYPGIHELLEMLSGHRVPTCIVTSSPRTYCERVMRHFRIASDQMVCYHDTKNHKPHPAPILLGIERLGRPAKAVWSVGDEPRDITASRAAGARSVAALWGCLDPQALRAAGADLTCESADDLRVHLAEVLKLN